MSLILAYFLIVNRFLQLLTEGEADLSSQSIQSSKASSSKVTKTKSSNNREWYALDNEDLRFQFSQKSDDQSFYAHLKQNTSLIFDFEAFLKAS